ncbi:MAG: hypothetical protein QOJ99_520 [Bryobacterales bacterium]|nr:hypothetical protein [Bryobacterales bacterium]
MPGAAWLNRLPGNDIAGEPGAALLPADRLGRGWIEDLAEERCHRHGLAAPATGR